MSTAAETTQTTTTAQSTTHSTQEGAAGAAGANSGGAAGGSGAPVTMTSDVLSKRLAEEREAARRGVFKKFGVEKESDLEARLAELAQLKQASMTEQEKVAAKLKELEPQAQRAKKLEALLNTAVQREIASLPEQVKAKLVESAGENLEEQMKYLEFLRGTGLLGAAIGQQQGGQGTQQGTAGGNGGQQPQTPPPANTGGGAGAPRPAGQRTKWDDYQDVITRHGPMAGEMFYLGNKIEIDRSRPSDS